MSLRDPIRIESLSFESLHADEDGNVILKLKLPPAECARAGLFPVMRQVVFSAVFTPEDAKPKKDEAKM